MALSQFPQHVLRPHEERVQLKPAPHDYHRVRPEDVHDDVGTEPGQIVGSDDRIIVLREDVIQPSFILDEISDAGPGL